MTDDQAQLWEEVKLNANSTWEANTVGSDEARDTARAHEMIEKINKEAGYPRPALLLEDLLFALERWSVARMHDTITQGQRVEGARRDPANEEHRVVFLRLTGTENLVAGVHRIGKWRRGGRAECDVIVVTAPARSSSTV